MVALAKTDISVSEICALNREIIWGGESGKSRKYALDS